MWLTPKIIDYKVNYHKEIIKKHIKMVSIFTTNYIKVADGNYLSKCIIVKKYVLLIIIKCNKYNS